VAAGLRELRQIAIGIAPEDDCAFVVVNCGRPVASPLGDDSSGEVCVPRVAAVLFAHLIRHLSGERPIVRVTNGACRGLQDRTVSGSTRRDPGRARRLPLPDGSSCVLARDHRLSRRTHPARAEGRARARPHRCRRFGGSLSAASASRPALAVRPARHVCLRSRQVTGGAQTAVTCDRSAALAAVSASVCGRARGGKPAVALVSALRCQQAAPAHRTRGAACRQR